MVSYLQPTKRKKNHRRKFIRNSSIDSELWRPISCIKHVAPSQRTSHSENDERKERKKQLKVIVSFSFAFPCRFRSANENSLSSGKSLARLLNTLHIPSSVDCDCAINKMRNWILRLSFGSFRRRFVAGPFAATAQFQTSSPRNRKKINQYFLALAIKTISPFVRRILTSLN